MMRIGRVDLAGSQGIGACHLVYLAARRADEPEGPSLPGRQFGGWLSVGWGGDPREVWAARHDGQVAGWYRLELPDLENLDQANLDLVVRPGDRRRGLGLALLRHAAARAAVHGRVTLHGAARHGSPGEAFAGSAGAVPGRVSVQRMLEIKALDGDRLAVLRELAGRAATGYSLVSWTGPVPGEFTGQAAALYAALSDAPHDPGTGPGAWDARRVRARVNDLRPRFGTRHYSVAARHEACGELAALTEMSVDPADPAWGHQVLTVVTRRHRGHRLGLLVKIAMLDLLRSAEPRLERAITWNAQANKHMIAINEALGYTIAGQPSTWFRLDVAAVTGKRG
jgi:GNAT superfamily N-acetyltransferase